MQANSIDHQLDEVSRRWDLLQHPFYKRWVAGELTRGELVDYAGQYSHVVRAIPRWLEAETAHDPRHAEELAVHAAEESEHIALWEQFAEALGIDRKALLNVSRNPSTAALIAKCDNLVNAGHGAAVVWSIEAQSPAVSAEKLRGLESHYGINPDRGGRYFKVHQELDKEHEARLRRIIFTQNPPQQQAAPAAAAAALEGMWDLLTSVQHANVATDL